MDFQLVQPFEIEDDAPLLAVNLEDVVILPSQREPRGFQRAERAVLELHDRREGVVYVHALPLSLAVRPLRDEGARDGGNGLDLANEEAGEVNDVRAKIAKHATPRHVLLQAPDDGEVRVENPLLQIP